METMNAQTRGLILGAPATGSGKTTVTLGLSVLLMRRGLQVSTAKVGPDYIDSAFHSLATGRACRNIDSWAMRPKTIGEIIKGSALDADILLVEGAMGLFDGAPDGQRVPAGSTAEIAILTGLPVVLVVSAKGLGSTVAAILSGIAGFDPKVHVAGVIFNSVASARHEVILGEAARHAGVAVLGHLPNDVALQMPTRHLGLVQAREIRDLESRLDLIADHLARHLDLGALISIAAPVKPQTAIAEDPTSLPIPPFGQRIAVASDDAFAFAYPAVIEAWRKNGAELHLFSPLADQGPDVAADAVFLPGGYPELYAGLLASNRSFLTGLRRAGERGAVIYGECGGYMALGETLIDEKGNAHGMAGLLPLVTSFASRKLHLGYRRCELTDDGPLGRKGAQYRGHEFHYASLMSGESDSNLFRVKDSQCRELGSQGRRQGSVMGSFLHLIDRA